MRGRCAALMAGWALGFWSGMAEATPLTLSGDRPAIISHRGASGYLPEETVQGYRLALSMRPDYIEGDVYRTADGVPVMLHDGTLNATTNVASYAATHPEIAALRSANGSYDVTKFTLAQVKQLDATCRGATGYCSDKTYYDPSKDYKIATYSEFLDAAYNNFQQTGIDIGVYAEAKQSGLGVASDILAGLNDPKYNGYFLEAGHAFTQSFDATQVAYLNANSSIPVTYLGILPTAASAAASVKAIADGVGPSTGQLSGAGVQVSHDAGLYVHPYTFYNDPSSYLAAFAFGVDGVFTNFPDIANSVREQAYPSPVPLPASAPLFGAAVLALGAVGYGMKRRTVVVAA